MMISSLEEALEDLQDSWNSTEDFTTISFTHDNLTVVDRERVFDQIHDIRSIIDGRSIVFQYN